MVVQAVAGMLRLQVMAVQVVVPVSQVLPVMAEQEEQVAVRAVQQASMLPAIATSHGRSPVHAWVKSEDKE